MILVLRHVYHSSVMLFSVSKFLQNYGFCRGVKVNEWLLILRRIAFLLPGCPLLTKYIGFFYCSIFHLL